MRRAFFNIFILGIFVFGASVYATQLDLANLGFFTEGSAHSGHPAAAFDPAGFTDGDVGTFGILSGHAPFPFDNNEFTVRYSFNAPQFVDTLRVHFSSVGGGAVLTRIFTTNNGIIDRTEPSLVGFEGFITYDGIQDTVTKVHFLGPVDNRYTINEVEIFDTPLVPEANTMLLLALASFFYFKELFQRVKR